MNVVFFSFFWESINDSQLNQKHIETMRQTFIIRALVSIQSGTIDKVTGKILCLHLKHSKYYSVFLGDKMVMSEQPLNKLGQLSGPGNLKSNHREQGIPNSNRRIPNFNSAKTSPQPIPSQSELFHNQLGQGCANSPKIQLGIG